MKFAMFFLPLIMLAQPKPRARDLGVPFDGTPGPLNAITDVAGIEVGHTTIIEGESVRTGVTAVFPRGRASKDPAFAAWYSQNGNGEMTGTTWIEESGFLGSPVMITNTHSVGLVRDSYIQWHIRQRGASGGWELPVVAETFDGFLNDINGFHVKPEHVMAALDGARTGPVAEGSAGGGTGMVCYGFKGGIGTASRKAGDYTIGVLVQCNCGRRNQLTIAGVPVGREIGNRQIAVNKPAQSQPGIREDTGSIIIVVATDAPLLPQQLKRLARRATMGLARTGSTSGNGSGDIFIAFSTANPGAAKTTGVQDIKMLSNDAMNPVFDATVEATEEAIVNAMVGAETMTGFQGHQVTALPHDALRAALRKYNRVP